VLAINEIDRTSGSAWERAMPLILLDGRFNRRGVRATLLASNVAPDGERVLVGGREMRGR
jgi:hypothetical protein